ncbi:MAG: hypothetical protein OIF50_06495 [Flavobacteriaceae bacterium]|nr:hypothetical protein [Flavobacteriaceae bacterium]
MYLEYKIIKDIIRQPTFSKNKMFTISKKFRHITCYNSQRIEIEWTIKNRDNRGEVWDNEIITSNLKSYNKQGEIVYQHINYLDYHFEFLSRELNLSVWKTINEETETVLYHFFDFDKKEMIYENINLEGIIFSITNCLIITNNSPFVHAYMKSDFIVQWQIDLSEYLTPEEDLQIKQIKAYNDNIIVVSNGGVVSIKADTGEVNWITKTYALTMEIVKNIGYCCSGLALYKINLESGELSGYGWKNHRLPDFTYNNKSYWPIGHEVVFHNGLLWYWVYSSGESFIIAINPHDGHYEWVHHVETNEKINSIQFHEDKMFLHDTGGTLHIYEKENNT